LSELCSICDENKHVFHTISYSSVPVELCMWNLTNLWFSGRNKRRGHSWTLDTGIPNCGANNISTLCDETGCIMYPSASITGAYILLSEPG